MTSVMMRDTPPGKVAEAVFGPMGMIIGPATGKRRAVRAMVIMLRHFRHCCGQSMQQHQPRAAA